MSFLDTLSHIMHTKNYPSTVIVHVQITFCYILMAGSDPLNAPGLWFAASRSVLASNHLCMASLHNLYTKRSRRTSSRYPLDLQALPR